MEVEKIDRKCKYYNGGHCKHKLKCKYSHLQEKFKDDVKLKMEIHEKRMKEHFDDDIKFSKEMFEKSLKALKNKG